MWDPVSGFSPGSVLNGLGSFNPPGGLERASSSGEVRIKGNYAGTSLVVQWLRLPAPNIGGPGLDPWPGN